MNCTTARHAIQLDLDGELTPLRKRALRRHLAGCDTCRTTMRQHTAIRVAMTRLAAQSPVPRGGGHPARLRVGGGHPARLRVGGGHPARLREPENAPLTATSPHHHLSHWRRLATVAAVIALCIASWRLTVNLRHDHSTDTTLVHPAPEPLTQPPAPRPVVRVEFGRPSDVIAIPKPTRNPNITILWVYPTVRTAEAKPSSAIEPDPNAVEGAHS